MTTKELLALPRANQSSELKKWASVLIVPTEQVFEDTPFRVMAFIGCVCENGCNVPTNVITTGDILNWEHGTDRLLMDMDAETNCVMVYNPGYRIQVYGGGGSTFAKVVKP